MAISNIVKSKDGSTIEAVSLITDVSVSVYASDLNLVAGIYTVTCDSSIIAEVSFFNSATGYSVNAITSSGTNTLVVEEDTDTVMYSTNSGSNNYIVVQLSSQILSTKSTITVNTIDTTQTYSTASYGRVIVIGGGGGGGGGARSDRGFGGGGGSGYLNSSTFVANSPISVTVGAGGAGSGGTGTPGGTTSFGNIVSAVGGSGGLWGSTNNNNGPRGGGPGGSGGGCGGIYPTPAGFGTKGGYAGNNGISHSPPWASTGGTGSGFQGYAWLNKTSVEPGSNGAAGGYYSGGSGGDGNAGEAGTDYGGGGGGGTGGGAGHPGAAFVFARTI